MARALAILAVLLAAPAASPEEPNLETVLARAAAYVAEFERQLSSIVAEERYVQESRNLESEVGRGVLRRELVSDLLLVKPSVDTPWMEFRDVFEVDGKPIRERNERLVKLFVEPSPNPAAQIDRILAESSRFNIGNIHRNVNSPILALQFLEVANQSRCVFTHTNDRKPKIVRPASGADVFRISTEMWTIAYEERGRPTTIDTASGAELPARGRLWIDPASGRVLMSELTIEDPFFRASIVVSFQSEPLLGMNVPIEMRERFDGKRKPWRVDGKASYGRFRQFAVNVDEVFTLKKK